MALGDPTMKSPLLSDAMLGDGDGIGIGSAVAAVTCLFFDAETKTDLPLRDCGGGTPDEDSLAPPAVNRLRRSAAVAAAAADELMPST